MLSGHRVGTPFPWVNDFCHVQGLLTGFSELPGAFVEAITQTPGILYPQLYGLPEVLCTGGPIADDVGKCEGVMGFAIGWIQCDSFLIVRERLAESLTRLNGNIPHHTICCGT